MIDSGEVIQSCVTDHNTGKYTIHFTPHTTGRHKLEVTIFGRHIRDSPILFDVDEHNNPVKKVGGRGTGQLEFVQPVTVAVNSTQSKVFVLDTGNSRIKVLKADDLSFVGHIGSHGLEQHSGTGMAVTPSGNLIVINWRTKQVTELTEQGEVVKKFTSEKFIEPVCVAVNSCNEIVVADNGLGRLLVFSSQGELLREIGSKGEQSGGFKLITAVSIALNDNILVTDNRLQVFSRGGNFIKEISPGQGTRGTYGGVTMDRHGSILATRQEKGKCFIAYFGANGNLKFTIDSNDDKLKRPSGLAVLDDGHVLVVDLGNDSVKKFRYM